MNWNAFDIVGPVMVGPSSSHTSGAVKLGLFANKLLGGIPDTAKVYLYGSYAEVYAGHGTDLSLIAGLLGIKSDSEKVVHAFEEAKKIGLKYEIIPVNGESDCHPNTAKFILTKNNKSLEVTGVSIGAGKIQITEINDMHINSLTGGHNTLIILNKDVPGVLMNITELINTNHINIATMDTTRNHKGGEAMTIITLDEAIPNKIIKQIENISNILWAKMLPAIH